MSDFNPTRISSLFEYGNRDSVRVLVFGYINLNVVDGSAFFIAGLAGMLGSRIGVEVDVLSANRIFRHHVVSELHDHDRVRIIDPFRDRSLLSGRSGWSTDHTLSRREAAAAVTELHEIRNYDVIIVRDTATAVHLVKSAPELAARLHVYVTGIAFMDREIDPGLIADLRSLHRAGARFYLQTTQMLEMVLERVPEFSRVEILGPFVPDNDNAFDTVANRNPRPSRLIYAGKFFPNWNPQKIVSGFSYARMSTPELTLDVAGDSFRSDEADPGFVEETKYLLTSTENLNWHGGLTRDQVRALVQGSDVGVSWRSNAMDSSTEFSTKVLEYGALGRPSILNRSPVNVSVLGPDYPLYVDDMTSFVDLLRRLPHCRDEVAQAAQTCWETAEAHSYSVVSERILSHVGVRSASTDAVLSLDDRKEDYLRVSAHERRREVRAISARGGRIDLHLHEGSAGGASYTVEEALLDIHFCMQVRRTAVESFLNDDPAIRAGTAIESLDEGSGTAISAMRQELADREADIARLTTELEAAKSDSESSGARLSALRGSKLGRLQTWWWRARTRTH